MATLNDTTFRAILERIAGGELVTNVAKEYGVSRQDIWRHCQDTSCLDDYTRARVSQAHSIAEDTLILADSAQGMSSDSVAAVRLQVDTRKWYTSKIAARIYGDPTRHVELTGAGGAPIQVEDVGQLRDTLTARLAGIASRRKLLTATARVVADDDAQDVTVEPEDNG